jgi:hypothetical protein
MIQIIIIVDLVGNLFSCLQQAYRLVTGSLAIYLEHDLIFGKI